MTGKKISELQALTEITGQEMIPVARGGQNYSVLSSLLQRGDATKLNDYVYDVSLLMGKMAVRGTKGTSKTTQPYGAGYYHVDGSYTELGSVPAVTTVIVDENKVYHFDIGYYKYTNIDADAAVLVLFDENNKVLTAVPWVEGGFLNKYLVFTSEVKKYGVIYNVSPAIKPYPSIYNETYEIEDINDVLSNMNTEIEANTASISAIESNINTSQGNRALYVAAGAVYNEQTGFYELNGLTDITEEQMKVIYLCTADLDKRDDWRGGIVNKKFRTNLGFRTNTIYNYLNRTFNLFNALRENMNLEVLHVGPETSTSFKTYPFIISQLGDCFYQTSVKKIEGFIRFDFQNINLTRLTLIEHIRIVQLKTNINFRASPNITLDSLQFLIQEATNTSAITVTVHADVYAKIQDETQTDWHALIEQAQEKNITFATD